MRVPSANASVSDPPATVALASASSAPPPNTGRIGNRHLGRECHGPAFSIFQYTTTGDASTPLTPTRIAAGPLDCPSTR